MNNLSGRAFKLGTVAGNKLKELHGNNEVKFADIKINGISIDRWFKPKDKCKKGL